MITHEMLAMAAEEVSDAMAANICPADHVFSARFEKKMDALIRRAAHPVRQRILRNAAAVLIVAVMAFGSLLLFSPAARAAVIGWVRSTFGGYFHYYSENNTLPDVEYDYFLPEEFDGYILASIVEQDFGKLFIYTNEDGQMLSFDYTRGTSNASVFLGDIEDHAYYIGFVNSLPADIYIAPKSDAVSIIVWHDPDENVLFSIGAFANKDELIEIAKKVEKTKNNKN